MYQHLKNTWRTTWWSWVVLASALLSSRFVTFQSSLAVKMWCRIEVLKCVPWNLHHYLSIAPMQENFLALKKSNCTKTVLELHNTIRSCYEEMTGCQLFVRIQRSIALFFVLWDFTWDLARHYFAWLIAGQMHAACDHPDSASEFCQRGGKDENRALWENLSCWRQTIFPSHCWICIKLTTFFLFVCLQLIGIIFSCCLMRSIRAEYEVM